MGFGGLLPGSGLSVRTALTNPSTRPGLTLPGRVAVTAGRSPVTVDGLALGLVTRVEPADGSAEYVPVEFHRVPVTGGFGLDADECRTLDFGVPVPWETPVTVVNGVCLLNLRMGLRTEVAVSPLLDRGDLRPVYVHPLPAQEGVLSTLTGLGFRLRQVGLLAGRLPGVAQSLPFHQKIGYWAAPLYSGPFSELEVSFFANPLGVEVVFALDRRIALAGAGHVSLSRFRVAHQGTVDLDWTNLVDGWIRYAVQRHAALGSGHPVRTARRQPSPPRSAAARAEADSLHPGPSGTNTADSQPPGAEPSGRSPGGANASDRDLRQTGGGESGSGGSGT